MGATDFYATGSGMSAKRAFDVAQEKAQYDNGHDGYTGTIAEKSEFVVIQSKPICSHDAMELAEKLIEDRDARIDDKWGPAGAIRLIQPMSQHAADATERWLFFGIASA